MRFSLRGGFRTFFYLTLIVIYALVHHAKASTFIWDPSSPSSIDTWRRPYPAFVNPPICVNIPANMTLCYGIKYSQMRIPNLLHHDSLNEVIQQSESWIQLTKLKCHPDTQLFLCSLFSPVCLDQTIPPCRSLCETVQRSCEPYMQKHGYTWPPMMRCDQFPVDNNMCIQSQSLSVSAGNHQAGGTPINRGAQEETHNANNSPSKITNQTIALPIEDKIYRRLLDNICKSDWVIRSGINNIHSQQVRVKNYKVLFGQFDHSPPVSLIMKQAIHSDTADTTENHQSGLKRKQRMVIVGMGKDAQKGFTVRLVLDWQKNNAKIKRALKSARNGACAKHTRNGTKRRQHSSRRVNKS